MEFPQRKPTRLPDFDYRTPRPYFVTICTHGRERFLANIHGAQLELTNPGRIVRQEWHDLPRHFPRIELGSFVVLPNHVHGIVIIPILDSDNILDPYSDLDTSLSTVVGFLKSSTARQINRWRGTPGAPVWQRSFYERIIRRDGELETTAAYIMNNPANWLEDEHNPNRKLR